ncbi:RluA family pseudouridine synthase [Deinococcus deserti]|uniref:Pseudouridine synthase n=1 Tax=Deinococcus deserti (strain DSM 17065 / CIP 109153 / LMG 22923 / VCD115) TaxID=546414 RepID=C1CZM0_DEIDV|nr:RluA family pseudouridine synthase [Deinococcus deserti]ACO47268.1 putative RNA pseudouridine synthase [Deinococcus deserti VCD115]
MPTNAGYTYVTPVQVSGVSVLDFLSTRYRHSAPEVWAARLAQGEVQVDGLTVQGHERLRAGQTLVWHRPPWQEESVPLHFEVLHEDASLLAVHKPSGLPTLPGGGFLEHTLLTVVRAQFPGASPLHRLGRGTSGVVLFARTGAAGSALARAWREQDVRKMYRALASGVATQDETEITVSIGPVPHPRLGEVFAACPTGKPSRSVARVVERCSGTTLFDVQIFTGRPHQIRIHLASIGQPLVGDPLYGPGGHPLPDLPGLPGDLGYLLHAHTLSFTHPVSGQVITVTAPAPSALEPTAP